MADIFAIFVLLSFVGLIAGVVCFFMKTKRQAGKKISSISLAIFILAFVGAGITGESLETAAQNAGFSTVADYQRAKKYNIKIPAEWQKKKAEIEAAANKEAEVETAKAAFYAEPKGQAAFVEAIKNARASYASVANDLAKGGVRRERAKAICAAVRTPYVENWVGTIAGLTTNGDGKGVLSIRAGDHVTVKTWNNAFSDIRDKTLIDPDTEMFKELAMLKKGQKIRFSGHFLNSGQETDCYRESSMTIDGAMDNPEFIFRFSSVDIFKTAD